MASAEQQAVLDRIEGSVAVLLVGEKQTPLNLPASRLPAGTREGDWLRLTLSSGQVVAIQPDPEETNRRRQRVQARLDLLRKRQQGK